MSFSSSNDNKNSTRLGKEECSVTLRLQNKCTIYCSLGGGGGGFGFTSGGGGATFILSFLPQIRIQMGGILCR